RAGSNPRSRFTCRSPLQHITRFAEVVFQRACQIGMTWPRRLHGLVFGRVALGDRQRLLPVLPIAVLDQDRNWGTNGLGVTHAGEKMCAVVLDLHATAAAVALLPPPQLAINVCLINGHTGW